MSWFKVDDKLHDHRKVAIAGADAMGLWLLAGSWCAGNAETDGFISTRVAARFSRSWRAKAAKLVEATLWEPAKFKGEDGYQFAHWAEYQFTAADKEKDRHGARERMRHLRAERKAGSEDVRPNNSEVRKSSPNVPDPVPVPVPDPVPNTKASANRRKPETPIPEDWMPRQTHYDHAKDGIDVPTEARAFRSHAASVDRRLRDWDAGFTTWLIKARPQFAPGRASPQRSTTDERMQATLALVADIAREEETAQRQIGWQ